MKPNILNEKSKTLHDYAAFLQFVLSYLKHGKNLKEAIELAVMECQRSEILNQYLKERKSEVFDMLALEFDIDKLKAASYEDGIEEGRAEGRVEGRAEGLAEGRAEGLSKGIAKGIVKGRVEERKEMILAFFQSGVSIEQIEKAVKLPKEKILEILEN